MNQEFLSYTGDSACDTLFFTCARLCVDAIDEKCMKEALFHPSDNIPSMYLLFYMSHVHFVHSCDDDLAHMRD